MKNVFLVAMCLLMAACSTQKPYTKPQVVCVNGFQYYRYSNGTEIMMHRTCK